MKKVFKPISIGIVLLFLFLITIFSFNVLKKDFKYAHQSYATYQDPFDWFSYNLKTKIIKIFLDLKKKDEEGLPVTSFHINKSFIKELLEKTPDSTKKWKDAFLINQDETFNKIKVRLKGDNPTNWLFEIPTDSFLLIPTTLLLIGFSTKVTLFRLPLLEVIASFILLMNCALASALNSLSNLFEKF